MLAFKRILLKLSGEALAGDKGFGVETSRIHSIAGEIKEVHELGVEIALVAVSHLSPCSGSSPLENRARHLVSGCQARFRD